MKNIFRLFPFLGTILFFPGLSSMGQVIISYDESSPHSSAMLEVKSDDKGLLPPRVALSDITVADPVSSPATGLVIFNTATAGTAPNNVVPGYYYWNGTIWALLSPPRGTNPGVILYWDGVHWTEIGAGLPGQFLQLSLSGVPEWSGDAYAALTTATVSSILTTTAVSGGTISSDGGAGVTVRGVCWSTSSNPVITGDHTTDGSGTGTFTSNLTGLTENALYYVRSYATNSIGTSYGNELSFMTLTLPVVTTAAVSDISTTTVTCGGEVTFDGNSTATVRGVCWGTASNPDINGSHTNDGNGEGSFVSSLTGLTEGTLYYVRAYATNDAGTSYGSETSFITSVADADGNIYNTIIIGTQMWLGENLKTTKYNDGTAIPYHSGFFITTAEYAWYDNNINYKDQYGALYNFTAVNTGLLCPTGWHVPTDAEWTVLTDYAGGVGVAGGKLKETGYSHWNSPNTGATNEYGLSIRAGGGTQQGFTGFISMGEAACQWTSTTGITRNFVYSNDDVVRGTGYNAWVKNSVRCIKNQ